MLQSEGSGVEREDVEDLEGVVLEIEDGWLDVEEVALYFGKLLLELQVPD